MWNTALFLVLAVLGGLAFWFASRRAFRRRTLDELEYRLFAILVPRVEQDGRQVASEINRSEQLFNALAAFKKPFVFEVGVPAVGQEIGFYAAVPESVTEAFTRQVHALWPEARVEPVHDYTIFNAAGAVAGATLQLSEPPALPIRTYREVESDTFVSILGGLAKIAEVGEGGAVQYAFMPTVKAAKQIRSALNSLKQGKSLKEVLRADTFAISVKEVHRAVTKGTVTTQDPAERVVNEAAVQALEAKLSKPLFAVNVRVLASAPTQPQADAILAGLTAGFSQFGAPERNGFAVVRPRSMKDLVFKFSFRDFDERSAMVLNSEEVASVFHLPTPFTDVPRVKLAAFVEAPPPPNLPANGIILGESRYRGERHPVRMLREDRRRHLYIIGQTGTGKSVTLNNLAGQDVAAGEGVCLIDPNGDFFEDSLARVPRERVTDLVVFDPGDLARPVGLNMLEYDPQFPEQKTFFINEMLNIFNTLYDLKVTGGPMFEYYMRNALLLLMDDPADGFTLLEVPRVLADAPFRRRLLEKCTNLLTKNFWEKEAEKAGGEASLANMVPYIASKFTSFTSNDYVRPIIAQSKSTLNFRKIMDEQQILLVNLSKGKIGDLNASLLGMIVVGKLTAAAFARADVPENERKDFYLYIDEFQNFTTPSIATILSEARKYRLCLTVAHQFIGQLSEEIRNAVFGNVGSMVAFRVGADDAEFLVKQFTPVFNEQNLINIANLNAHAKLMIGNQVTRPFTIFVPFPPRGDRESAKLMKEYSRLTYGRDRAEVEAETYQRLKS